MRLMYGAPPPKGGKRQKLLDGLATLTGPPLVDPPPEHAAEELAAFNAIVGALKALTTEQRRRVLRSVATWYGMTVT
jgi:hypothetical protein